MMAYFRPNSLSWWSGVAAIAIGLVGGLAVEIESVRPVWSVLEAWFPGLPPGAFILYGTSTIGLRAAITKAQEGRA